MQSQSMIVRKVLVRRRRYDGDGAACMVEVEVVTNRGVFRCGAEDDADEESEADVKQQEVLNDKLSGLNVTKHDLERIIADSGVRYRMLTSCAVLRAAAEFEDKLFVNFLREKAGQIGSGKRVFPLLAFTIFSGGSHAGNMSPIRGVGVAPTSAGSVAEAVRMAVEVYHTARQLAIAEFGAESVNTGTCGGLAAPSSSLDSPMALTYTAIEKAGYESRMELWIDMGAEELYDTKTHTYNLSPKSMMKTELKPKALLEVYMKWMRTYPILAFQDAFNAEDPSHTADLDAWADLTKLAPLVTTPRVERLAAACETAMWGFPLHGCTVQAYPDYRKALHTQHKVAYSILRTDRTTDPNDVVLATAFGMPVVKLGAPVRGENTAKVNELLRIEEGVAQTGKTWVYGKRHLDVFSTNAQSSGLSGGLSGD